MSTSLTKQYRKIQDVEKLKSQYHKSVTQSINALNNSAFNLMCTLYGNLLFCFNNRLLFPVKALIILRKFTKEVVDKKIFTNFSLEQQDIFIDILLFINKYYSFKGCLRLAEEIAGSIINDKKNFLPIRLVVSAKLIEAKIFYKKNLRLDKLDLMEEVRHKHTRKNLGIEKDYRDTIIRVARLLNDQELLKAVSAD